MREKQLWMKKELETIWTRGVRAQINSSVYRSSARVACWTTVPRQSTTARVAVHRARARRRSSQAERQSPGESPIDPASGPVA